MHVSYLFVELVKLFPTNRTVASVVFFPDSHSTDDNIFLSYQILLSHVLNCLILDLIIHDPIKLLEKPLPALSPPGNVLLPPIDPDNKTLTNALKEIATNLSYLRCQS